MVEICRTVEVICSQVHVMQNNSTVNSDYNVNKILRQFLNDQKSKKESPELRNLNFICFHRREAHTQHMENFAKTLKRKITLQNAVISKKLTMLKNIIVPNLMTIAKCLKMKLYL